MNQRQTDEHNIAMGLSALFFVQQKTSGMVPGAIEPTNANITECAFALQGEIFEMVQELGWKSWKQNPEMTAEQQEKIAEEFADILAFLGRLIVLIEARTGIIPPDLAEAFMLKNDKNQARFRGESGEPGYNGFHPSGELVIKD